MRFFIIFISLILISSVFSSCCTPQKADMTNVTAIVSIPGPNAIIYKTRKDYSKLVVIILSDDKKSIESYPDIKDVFYNGVLAYPTKLHDGFFLDNRGINKNAAFLKLTYEEYSKLPKTPSSGELMEMIIDKNPLRSMYNVGSRPTFKDIEHELNNKIDAGDFTSFIKIK